MTWAYVAVGVASLGSAYLGSQSAKKAGKAASAGEQAAIDEARRQFDLVRSDTAGQRFVGNAALSTLARLYGYGPVPTASPFTETSPQVTYTPAAGPSNKKNAALLFAGGGGLGSVLGAAGLIKGFGSAHGDEKRNLDAFFKDNKVYDLGNGKLALADGTTFDQSQLKDIAGTYYGATYAPDGNQSDWQQRYQTLLGGLQKTPVGNAGGGLTSDGVPNSAPLAAGSGGANAPTGPDMSVFSASPDFNFNLNEGQKAIDRSAAARGGLLSGGAQREGIRYASGLASREYSNFVDRLMQQAGLGTTGIGASASAGANTAGIVSNAAQNGAAARGSAYLTGGAAVNNSLQGGIQNLLLAKYLGG